MTPVDYTVKSLKRARFALRPGSRKMAKHHNLFIWRSNLLGSSE